MLSKFKSAKHQQHLAQLPKLVQSADDVETLFHTRDFKGRLLAEIAGAKKTVYISALYIEHDDAGRDFLDALYAAKKANPELDIKVFVDWHRAQRGRIGAEANATNADWYHSVAVSHPDLFIPIFGVPVNTREALGVLHLKGFIIDDTVIYSGASVNNVYLYQHDKYRYDRYHFLRNPELAAAMKLFIDEMLLPEPAVQKLDTETRVKTPEIKNLIRDFRLKLRHAAYHFTPQALPDDQLAVTPLIGLGKKNMLNNTIEHLMCSAQEKVVICTPYFNLPSTLVRIISRLLRDGKQVEIIIGDKTANDFYIPPEEPFKIIGGLPYLYEINLRRFMQRLQRFSDSEQLTIRLWKDDDNTYHLKGMWVDNQWQLITGNNLNPRAWGLDLENAILIRDPKQELHAQRQEELANIRTNTTIIRSYTELDNIRDYPVKIKKLLRRLRRVRLDRLISRIL